MKATVWAMAIAVTVSCYAAAVTNSREPATPIALEIIDHPEFPQISAKLKEKSDSLAINGEVHKQGSASLDGYVSIVVIAPDGHLLWSKNAELTSVGMRLFRYRIFDAVVPSLPPAGSKVTIEFHRRENISATYSLKLPVQSLIL